MIRSIIDLVTNLKENGVKNIEKYLYIKHGPTIGEMYEGMTKELMEKSIFDTLDLKVCSGFIKNSIGDMSKQIDCMIVLGEGEKIPGTDKYVYLIDKVIAVIEVKKDLFSQELVSAYANLLSVKNITQPNRDMNIDMLDCAYRSIVGNILPAHDAVRGLETTVQYTYHALVVEAYLPLRIAFGYSGFKSEQSLRDAFVSYLHRNQGVKGGGVVSFPNLIVSGDYALVKTNGMPYALASESKEWIAYGSYDGNPMTILLELLWTRLYYMFRELPQSIFGEEDIIESINPLLVARGSAKGWLYTVVPNYVSEEDTCWKPVELSEVEHAIIILLCRGRRISITDEGLIEYCLESGTTIQQVCKKLCDNRIVSVEEDELILLTKECVCSIYNGKYYVGEDCNGQMSRWLASLENGKVKVLNHRPISE